ncbi:MAG TPA: serine/threonine-protein kinase [Polyangia bacterium]
MPTDSPRDSRAGTVLEGAYHLTRLIGEGSMGSVYEAVQLRLGKRVAVKVLARHLATNQKSLARFHREAEITSRLGHPHLVSLVDYGQAESGEPYLVMEYLEGEDLDHRLRRVGRMPIEAVVHVVKQVASALSAAHAQGIVHRDLKPGNIFLVEVPGESDFVKVLDFGISKMMAARTRLTKPSVAMGTPFYMSPEQATGMTDAIDHRIDQWALACIAWEMLLGERPFVANDPPALLYKIVTTEPQPLTPLVPGLPAAVEPVLRRALRKRAAERFPSIRDFSFALASAVLGRPADLTPTPAMVAAPTLLDGSKIGHGDAQAATTPGFPPADRTPRNERQPDAGVSPAGADSVRAEPRRRVKPISIIVAAAGVLLLLAGFLWFRSGPTSSPTTKAANHPVTSPPIIAPIPPPPAAPAVVTPERTEVKPVGLGPEPARAKRSKTAHPAGTSRRERTKHPTPPPPRPGGKRPLFENL